MVLSFCPFYLIFDFLFFIYFCFELENSTYLFTPFVCKQIVLNTIKDVRILCISIFKYNLDKRRNGEVR